MKGLRIATIILLILQIIVCAGVAIWAFTYGGEVAGEAANQAANSGSQSGNNPVGGAVAGAVAGGAAGIAVMLIYILLGGGFIALGIVTIIALIIYLIRKHPSLLGGILALIIVNPIIGVLMIVENQKAKQLPTDIAY